MPEREAEDQRPAAPQVREQPVLPRPGGDASDSHHLAVLGHRVAHAVEPGQPTLFQHRGKDDPNPYQVEHDELFDAIMNGEYRYADAESGAYATMTSILGRMAAYSGNMIEWDEAIASDLSIMPERYAWDADPPVMPDEYGRYPIPMPGQTKVL